MLKLAVEGQIPLIRVATRDVLNFPDVVAHLTKQKVEKWSEKNPIGENRLYFIVHNPDVKYPLYDIYKLLAQKGSSMFLVNFPMKEPMYDVGEAPVPKDMLHALLMKVVQDKDHADKLARALGGCTLKESTEIARITMARDDSFTPDGVMRTRKSGFQGSKGLTQVDLGQDFYVPPVKLASWFESESMFFLKGQDHRLIPRGLLFDGPPGTGKTAGAKWLASSLQVPLYRVDIGGTKNKYVGESEANMLTNLWRLDHEEPCVALIDEVEKVFNVGTNDSSGTTATMLSQLLWWLAERRARVLVIMTTNNAVALPKELHREGRVDETLWFGGLEKEEALDFCRNVVATFNVPAKVVEPLAERAVEHAFNTSIIPNSDPYRVAQAGLTSAVYGQVKHFHMSSKT